MRTNYSVILSFNEVLKLITMLSEDYPSTYHQYEEIIFFQEWETVKAGPKQVHFTAYVDHNIVGLH